MHIPSLLVLALSSLALAAPPQTKTRRATYPAFSSLPLTTPGPRGNAWGLYGADDQLGTLNQLTPAVVAAAAGEIQTGHRVSLDWPLNVPRLGFFGRPPVVHTVIQNGNNSMSDTLELNTQSSTQWDGMRHYGYAEEKLWYGGRTRDQVLTGDTLGQNHVSEAGGITGRGVLIDWARWAKANGKSVSPFTAHLIPVEQLRAAARDQGLKLKAGDILFLRTGFTEAFNKLTVEEEKALGQRPSPDFIGVKPAKDTLEWLWESRFSAVAGDAPAFETASLEGAMTEAEYALHAWLIAGWGMPVGELFDLEKLSKMCEEKGRWSFFVASVPLKVPGGVAGPANAVAIF
ncbi:putative cyclase-domain-containing protein [Geopyxis carbonaria]|nr:putative cyclase-domain-containing protein [Geopyxis carbonaria]